MKDDKKQKKSLTRRRFLPFLGGGLLLPFFGSAKAVEQLVVDDEYQTLLTKDGKAVRVKKNALDNSKVVEKNLSNKSLLSWLKKNDETT